LPSERTITDTIKAWIAGTQGDFSATDMDRELENATKRDKATRNKVMCRLVEAGVIQRCNKNGWFRRVDDKLVRMDFLNAANNQLELAWPLGLERLVGLFPGTICVVNGVKDAGKTAFLLRFIQLNQAVWGKRIHYFNSEMGEVELKNRLSKFEIPLSDWTFNAYARSGNFSDVIKRDDINVIDFMEIHDDFFKIGGMMRDIHDRLRNGIAVIAVQKNPHNELGLGGYRSIEKARLVLNIEDGKLLIFASKVWANPEVNPSKTEIGFKLVGGCKFIEDYPAKVDDTDADPETYLMGKDKYGPTFTRR